MKKETKGVMLTILSVLLCICTAGRVEASGLDAICVSVLIASLIFGISGKILIGDEH